ncbi:MAG: aldolase [Propionibacteriales bacterium]|nr:aldolase [Propionibacteriales bacterium]
MARLYPGDHGRRQPVHTVYVPAERVTADITRRWGAEARWALDEHAPTPQTFAEALRRPDHLDGGALAMDAVWASVLLKLETEPIEDLRIDLEDGYGVRDDDVEDRDALAAAAALVEATGLGTAPPYCGIRFKSLETATRRRGLRTLDLFLGALLAAGDLPDGWVVTLPKVTSVEQVHAMVEACMRLETAYGLPERRLRFELQVETPQSILSADGTALVARLVHESDGRCTGLHFGTYDYTAALGISAAHQAMDHPAAEHAKNVMALAAAGTGVRLSDGSSNMLPVGDRQAVHHAWALHARLVRRSLERGFYQGWDLHPAQLPTRFAATYIFFRHGISSACSRLRTYIAAASGQGQDGSLGQYVDEPATAQALASFVRRGVHCGAVPADLAEAMVAADLQTLDDLANRRVG